MKKLTERQKEIYAAILDYMYQIKIPPTVNSLRRIFEFKSNNSVSCHLEALKKKGYIELGEGKARGIRITDSICPYCRKDNEQTFNRITHLAMEMLEMVENIYKRKTDKKIVTMNALARNILMFSSFHSGWGCIGKHEDRIHKLLVQQINTKQKIIEEDITIRDWHK